MTGNIIHIKLKAAILIIVFSLNTVIGFACSFGLEMGFNNHHHDKDNAVVSTSSTQHHAGSMHSHSDKKEKQSSSKNNENDCCSHGVTSFNLLVKSLPEAVKKAHQLITIPTVAFFYYNDLVPTLIIPKNIKSFAQNYHPPIPDIRIAIKSFLI